MDTIFHRTSIRIYENRLVEQEKIVELMKAAMVAPLAGNQQPLTDRIEAVRTFCQSLKNLKCLLLFHAVIQQR